MSKDLAWRDVSYRDAVRIHHWREATLDATGLDETSLAPRSIDGTTPFRQEVAKDKDVWQTLDSLFVARLLRG